MTTAYALGADWFTEQENAIIKGIKGDGVVSGCAVTAQTVPDMTIHVAAGSVMIANKIYEIAADDITITAAHATDDRVDTIYANTSSAFGVKDGTASATYAQTPHTSTTQIPLAYVSVPHADTDIDSDQITDGKILIMVPYGSIVYESSGHTNYTSTASGWETAKTVTIPANSFKRSDSLAMEFFAQCQSKNLRIVTDVSGAILTPSSVSHDSEPRHFIFRMMSNQTAGSASSSKSFSVTYDPYKEHDMEIQEKEAKSETEVNMSATFDLLIQFSFSGASQTVTISNIRVFRVGYLPS